MIDHLLITERDYKLLAGSDWPSYENFLINHNVPDFVHNELKYFTKNVAKFNNQAFCVLPFYSIEYPSDVQCCIMQPSLESIDVIRNKMLNGDRPDACRLCWNLEDKGFVSDRILKNNHLDFVLDKDLKSIEQDCKNNIFEPTHYKIDTSNTCNATCITCSGFSSTSWIRLEKKQKINKNKSWNLQIEKIKINYKTAKSINFRGGESLLSSTNFEILENLIKSNNTDCFISFTTNGSIRLTKKQKEILSKFNKVNFCLSIDGTESVFEYLRFPLKWNDILANINDFRENNFTLSVSYTISNINIMYYTETVNWLKQNELPFLHNIVEYPDHFRPTSLAKSVKDKIKNVDLFFANHNHTDDLLFNKFLIEIKKQDEIKKIQMKDYVPKFYTLIKEFL